MIDRFFLALWGCSILHYGHVQLRIHIIDYSCSLVEICTNKISPKIATFPTRAGVSLRLVYAKSQCLTRRSLYQMRYIIAFVIFIGPDVHQLECSTCPSLPLPAKFKSTPKSCFSITQKKYTQPLRLDLDSWTVVVGPGQYTLFHNANS